jgi:hypothetical protein
MIRSYTVARVTRAAGPHTRNSMSGRKYRGSNRRLARLSPFEDLPALLVLIGVALLSLGLCGILMYSQR